MKSLREYLEELGCSDVQSYIQSGNVVFRHHSNSTSKLKRSICSAVETNHNFKPELMILDERQIQEAIDENPYNTETGKFLHFYFFEDIPDNPDTEKLDALKKESEDYTITRKTLYLYAPEGIGRSKLAANVEKCSGVATTARNWNTIQRLSQLLERV